MDEWISPDNKIKKVILVKGIDGPKPTESCNCIISITDSNRDYNCETKSACIGDSNDEFGRLLDIVLQMMHETEVAKITFNTKNVHEFTLQLLSFKSKGLIYEWDAQFKCNLALLHKNKGNDLFRNGFSKDASYRFSKGLKIILSIPINVQENSNCIDGIPLTDINNLKANLYNNLASCYLKVKKYEHVISLCEKVLLIDSSNIKARYKIGAASYELHNFDQSFAMFQTILNTEPENKAVLDYIRAVKVKLNEENRKYNVIVKKMFK